MIFDEYILLFSYIDQIIMKRGIQNKIAQFQLDIDTLILKRLAQISPRVTRLYEDIRSLNRQDRSQQFTIEQYKAKLQRLLQIITYKNQHVGGPICRQNYKKTLFFHCFDCQKDNMTSICQECFQGGQHTGHNFRTYSCRCYCDCGNQQVLNRQYFCSKHKHFTQPKAMDQKQAQIFSKQFEFLLMLCFRCFEDIDKAAKKKRQGLILLVLDLYKKYISVNYNYQKLAADVLLSKFDEDYNYQDYENDIVLSMLMDRIEWSETTMKHIAKFLVELHPVYKARVQLIVSYWNIINQGLKPFKLLLKMQTFDSQLMSQSNIILGLLKKGEITPLSVNQHISSAKQELSKFYILYKLYQHLSHSLLFGQIMNLVLQRINISSFYNYRNCAAQGQNVSILQASFIDLLLKIIAKINLHANRRQIFLKMAQQSYAYLKQCHGSLRRCSKITFSLSLFALYDFDLGNLRSSRQQQLASLLEMSKQQSACQLLNELIWQQNTLIVNIIKQERELQNNPQLLLSAQYLFYKVSATINLIFHKKINFDSQIETVIAKIKEKSLLAKNESQIDQVGLEAQSICQTILNIIYSCETSLPETIIQSSLHKADKAKVLSFYRSLYGVNKDIKRKDFKDYAQRWIDNEECLRQFIVKESSTRQQKDCAQFNISFLSEYCKFFKVKKEEVQERLKANLNHQKSELNLVLGSSLKNLELLLTYLTNCEKIYQSHVQPKYLIDLLIVMLTWTKSSIYSQLIERVFAHIKPDYIKADYVEYGKRIKEILNKKNDEAGTQSIKSNRAKKMQKLQELRLKQQKHLQQYKQQISNLKDSKQQQNLCIVCRSNKHQQLSFLCSITYTNNLMKAVFKADDYFALISTCGHAIHQKCLSQNLNQRDIYVSKFSCFLCKRISNLRIPVYSYYTKQTQKQLQEIVDDKQKTNACHKWLKQFLAVLTLQIQNHQNQMLDKKDLKINIIGRIVTKSIIYSIYFYFLAFPKLYISYMLPFLGSFLSILRFSIENEIFLEIYKPEVNKKDKYLQVLEKLLLCFVCPTEMFEAGFKIAIQKYAQEQQISIIGQIIKLKKYILSQSQQPFNYQKRILRLKLFSIPKDLVHLNKLIGHCHFCKRIHSKIKICIYCSIKICIKCSHKMHRHIDEAHGGSAIMIDAQFGQQYYYYNRKDLRCQSLYCNYIGETFAYEHKKLKEGYYLLDDKLEETLITNALLQNMEQVVQADNDDPCHIQ